MEIRKQLLKFFFEDFGANLKFISDCSALDFSEDSFFYFHPSWTVILCRSKDNLFNFVEWQWFGISIQTKYPPFGRWKLHPGGKWFFKMSQNTFILFYWNIKKRLQLAKWPLIKCSTEYLSRKLWTNSETRPCFIALPMIPLVYMFKQPPLASKLLKTKITLFHFYKTFYKLIKFIDQNQPSQVCISVPVSKLRFLKSTQHTSFYGISHKLMKLI